MDLKQTSFTASISGLFVTTIQTFHVSDDYKKAIISGTAILVPFLASFCIKLYSKYNQPPKLVSYRAGIERDLTQIIKQLKDPETPQKTKKILEQKHAELSTKLATINTDYLSNKIDIKTDEDV